MTREHLTKILKTVSPDSVCEENIDVLYEPTYSKICINESELQNGFSKMLTFDYNKCGMIFISGEISCSGIKIRFKTERFQEITVVIMYDYLSRQIYNSVLAMPKYTDYDMLGKSSISQAATKIKSDKDIIKYFNRLYKRFECPVLK